MTQNQTHHNKERLLELIPEDQLSLSQKELRENLLGYGEMEIFQYSREPNRLDEFEWRLWNMQTVIWRNNETFLCVFPCSYYRPQMKQRSLYFTIVLGNGYNLYGAICGKTDEAIAETATFFWSLQDDEEGAALYVQDVFQHGLCAGEVRGNFDFAAFRPQQLIRILESNPTRQLQLRVGSWSLEQAKILATRTFPLNLEIIFGDHGDLGNRGNKDEDGTEFFNSLEERRSSFGSLEIGGGFYHDTRMNRVNFERLTQLDWIIDKLRIYGLDSDSVLLPFSAKVNALSYGVIDSHIQPNDFEALTIVTNDLSIWFYSQEEDDLSDWLIAFFDRVAQLGHFVRLGISIRSYERVHDMESCVQALTGAIKSNPNLRYLKMYGFDQRFQHAPHWESLYHAIGEHQQLRTITLDDNEYKKTCQDFYLALERLLSCNRNVTVIKRDGKKFTNETSIDQLYALNNFFNGSLSLTEESVELRPVLFAVALEKASASFQYTGLLLSQHTDVLWELVDGTNLEEVPP
ncbi:hypothetical protein FisN_10Lh397 [Fistulifera solaris]|uniref:Uncharacterized protein n=1 Tax=Fistulifera solaris TaxID=1519565 RepID=A0A1Z5JV90_FISSO|nr:hypothetical protein FisN_10Lh397 [Fistulifera solaris]|eukprot:GAX17688.1 hypothetical protein FisN_10Lh397 [Fistulifera solaris]